MIKLARRRHRSACMHRSNRPMARSAALLAPTRPAAAAAVAADHLRYTAAEFPPNKLLYLCQLADQRGIDSRPWFAGLSLNRAQIADPALRVSYRQASTFVRRALDGLDVPDAGLRIGREGTIGSFLLDLSFEPVGEHAIALVATPQFDDQALLPFFCEELFASSTMISRELVGPELRPLRVELSYPRPAHAHDYADLFQCELQFDAARCRLLIETRWLAHPLPGYNPLTAKQALALCAQQRTPDGGEPHQEIVAAVERLLRTRLRDQPKFNDVARTLNLSERSLRRKLAESGRIFREIHDRVRAERAVQLLQGGALSVAEIGSEVGFNDPREFRRAFKRWTGMVPQQARRTAM